MAKIKRVLITSLIISLFAIMFSFQTVHADTPVQFYLSEESRYVEGHYALISDVSFIIPSGSEDMYIYTPLIADWYTDSVSGTIDGQSYFYFHSGGDSFEYLVVGTDTPELGSYDTNTLRLELDTLLLDGYDYVAFQFWFELPIEVQKSNIDNAFVEFWSDNFEVTFDLHPEAIGGAGGSPIWEVVYRHNLEVWYRTYTNGIPVEPYEPTRGQDEFYGWRFEDYVMYEFAADLEPPTYPLPPDLHYTLYSAFRTTEEGIDDIEINDDSRIESVMRYFGLYNTPGFMIVYVSLVILLTVLLLLINLPIFAIVLIHILIAGVFTFMGWLPFYAIIIIIFTLITFLFFSFKRGG